MPALTTVKKSKFEKFLRFVGCEYKRTKGDHLIYGREGLKRPVVVTADREVPVFIIRSNLKTLNMSPEEFLEVLKKI
ncbi:MAG: type II toxin-antitoxin system HicA family toxin [bacterium]|nr:type II toxin-antitoxin system HicA family toxin [bacterium]